MKNTLLSLLAISFFLTACVDKKAQEEEAKNAAELNEQIETVAQEIEEDFDSLEKEAKELENTLNELDNL